VREVIRTGIAISGVPDGAALLERTMPLQESQISSLLQCLVA